MKHIILFSTLVFMFSACSDNAHHVQKQTGETKDYLEIYYEEEEERHNEYIASLN